MRRHEHEWVISKSAYRVKYRACECGEREEWSYETDEWWTPPDKKGGGAS